ncbi:MAG: HD domain-containing phosphohydrolase, partial [Nitrospirota bacterium]
PIMNEIKILMLEDSAADAELIEYELRKSGLSFIAERVATKDGFIRELEAFKPDLVLCDYTLPSFDGASALDVLREKYPDLPFIFVSGTIGEERAIDALKQGASDYVLKNNLRKLPFAVNRALSEAADRFEIRRTQETLRKNEEHYRIVAEEAQKSRDAFFNMLEDLGESYRELEKLFMGLVKAMVNALDAKSKWTRGHSERVALYATKLAKETGMDGDQIKRIQLASLLHDIGKIGTYDYLLDKPTKLTAEEFEVVKKHPAQGSDILKGIKQLRDIVPLIRHHHERIDGKGYPDGLKGDEIPLGARILHIADSFDSMTADRPYRPAPSREYAISELKRCAGSQFDSGLAEKFLGILSGMDPEK